MTNKFEDFKLIRPKSSMYVNDGSVKGGFYKLNSEIYVIKEQDTQHTIKEYICSYIARIFIGENAPIVTLLKGRDDIIYSASKFIPGFETVNRFYEKGYNLPDGCFPYGCKIDSDGSIIIINYGDDSSNLTLPIIEGVEDVEVLIQLIGYNDDHACNRGIRNKSQASLVDYGQCFASILDSKNYIKNLNKKKIIAALDKIASLKINSLISPIFKDIKTYYHNNEEVDAMKQKALKTIHSRQESLIIDKNILLLTAENPNNNQLLQLIEPHFKKAGKEAKFILCSFIKKNTTLLFNKDKCNNVKSPYSEDIVDTVIYNNKAEFKRILNSYLTPNFLTKLYETSKSLLDLEKSFQQIIIYQRNDLLNYSLSKILGNFADTKFYPKFLSSLVNTAVTYNRSYALNKLIPLAQKHCSNEQLALPIKKAIEYSNDKIFELLMSNITKPEVLEDVHEFEKIWGNFTEHHELKQNIEIIGNL